MGKDRDDDLAVRKHLKVFIGSLPNGVREAEVGHHFAKYGHVLQVSIIPQNDKPPYAFASFKFAADADAAVTDPQNFPGVSRPLNMGFAQPKGAKNNRDSGGDGDPCKVFVGGISDRDNEEQLGDFFSQWGLVILVYRDRQWGYVAFATKEAANRLLDEGSVIFQKRRLDIKPSDSQKRMDEGERHELCRRAIARHFHKKTAAQQPQHALPPAGYPPPGAYPPPGHYGQPPPGYPPPHGAPPPGHYGAPPPGYPPSGYPPQGAPPPGYPPQSYPPPGGGAPPGYPPAPSQYGGPPSGGPPHGAPPGHYPPPSQHPPPGGGPPAHYVAPGSDPYARPSQDPYARPSDAGHPGGASGSAPPGGNDYYRDSRGDGRRDEPPPAAGGYYRESQPRGDPYGQPPPAYAPAADPYGHGPPPQQPPGGNPYGGGGGGGPDRYRPY